MSGVYLESHRQGHGTEGGCGFRSTDTLRQFRLDELMTRSGVFFGTSGARGLVSEMTDEVCYAYTLAFLRSVAPDAHQVIIGHDLRPSSPQITKACAAAISDAGMEVVYAGALPTPALACYAAYRNAPAIMVTGSHIPFDRNGIKFYRADGEISKADEQLIASSVVDVPEVIRPYPLASPNLVAINHYIARYVDFFGKVSLNGMRIAVYEHSSAARDVIRAILEALGAEVIALGRTETFVPIDTEAVRPEDIARAKKWADEHHFDALLSTDGDADRPLIADELGTWFRGDVVGILCAQFLEADVVVTPVSSNTAVEKCGSFRQVIRTRIGSPFVIAGMQSGAELENNGVVGYEANGGFLLGTDVTLYDACISALPTRDALLPMLALLALSRQQGVRLSALTASLPARYTASDRLQDFPTIKSAELIRRLAADVSAIGRLLAPTSGDCVGIDMTDGLRATFARGDIVHLRPSGNAPELRCYAEADTQAAAQRLCQACLDAISAT